MIERREEAVPPAKAGGVKAESWNDAASPLSQTVREALDEIEQRLQQMLALAHLSVSGNGADRPALQKKLEQLKKEIDGIADDIASI